MLHTSSLSNELCPAECKHDFVVMLIPNYDIWNKLCLCVSGIDGCLRFETRYCQTNRWLVQFYESDSYMFLASRMPTANDESMVFDGRSSNI